MASGECERTLHGHTDCVHTLAVLGNPDRLASGSWDGTIRVWSVWRAECVHVIDEHYGHVNALVWLSSVGVLASALQDNTIKIWNPSNGHLIHTFKGHSDDVQGEIKASHFYNNILFNINILIGLEVLELLSDNRLASGASDGSIHIWNVTSGVCLHVLRGHWSWVNLLAEMGSDRLASGGWDGTIRVWNLNTGECLKTIHAGIHNGLWKNGFKSLHLA